MVDLKTPDSYQNKCEKCESIRKHFMGKGEPSVIESDTSNAFELKVTSISSCS